MREWTAGPPQNNGRFTAALSLRKAKEAGDCAPASRFDFVSMRVGSLRLDQAVHETPVAREGADVRIVAGLVWSELNDGALAGV